jgi:hypothetical protein
MLAGVTDAGYKCDNSSNLPSIASRPQCRQPTVRKAFQPDVTVAGQPRKANVQYA